MREFVCVYYQTDSGRIPVKEFIDSLNEKTQEKYLQRVELLADQGKDLSRPYSDYLGEGIYELRFVGIEGQVRVLYFFFFENKIIFTNGFIKKRRKTPKLEIKLAQERRSHYIDQQKDKL